MTNTSGNLGRACKVAVNLDTGDYEAFYPSEPGWASANAFALPSTHVGPGWVDFVTVEGLVEEMATDTFLHGRFEEPVPYHPGDEPL